MNTYKLLISEAALADIENAIDWYNDQRADLGYELLDCLESGFSFILQNPVQTAKKYDHIRVHFIKRFPYGIHYEIETTAIKVHAVFHMKQNPLRWNQRLDS